MRTPSGPRQIVSRLFESVHRRFNRIATIFAVALLTIAGPAAAEIVYTPASVTISKNGSIGLDLNNDGIIDFTLQEVYAESVGCDCVVVMCNDAIRPPQGQSDTCAPYDLCNASDSLEVIPAKGSGEVLIKSHSWAAALSQSVEIGPSSFVPASEHTKKLGDVSVSYFVRGFDCSPPRKRMLGPWINVSNVYLGLEFEINGETHYGWAQLSVQVDYVNITATLTGYAYETIPGMPINAGQTE